MNREQMKAQVDEAARDGTEDLSEGSAKFIRGAEYGLGAYKMAYGAFGTSSERIKNIADQVTSLIGSYGEISLEGSKLSFKPTKLNPDGVREKLLALEKLLSGGVERTNGEVHNSLQSGDIPGAYRSEGKNEAYESALDSFRRAFPQVFGKVEGK